MAQTLNDRSKGSTATSDGRVILHVDLDCFYAAVEAVRLGIPRDTPLAVQQWEGLIAVNYAARARGVQRHDRVFQAKQKCPELQLIHVETVGGAPGAGRNAGKVSLERYRAASQRVFAAFRRVCPSVERASIDEAYMDVSAMVDAMLSRPPAAVPPAPDEACPATGATFPAAAAAWEEQWEALLESVTEVKAGGATEVKEGSVTEVKAGGATEVKEGSVTEAKAGGGTEVKEGSVTEVKARGGTEVKEGSVTEAKAGSGTEVKEESETAAKAGSVTDEKAEGATEAKAEETEGGGNEDGTEKNDSEEGGEGKDGVQQPQQKRVGEMKREHGGAEGGGSALAVPKARLVVREGPLDARDDVERRLQAGVVIAHRLQQEVLSSLGYTVSVGVARCKLLAKMASAMTKPFGITVVPPRAVPALMENVPLKKIRNLGGKLGQELQAMGCAIAGQAQALELPGLIARFGDRLGNYVWRAVRGLDETPVEEKGVPKSMLAAKSFNATSSWDDICRPLCLTAPPSPHPLLSLSIPTLAPLALFASLSLAYSRWMTILAQELSLRMLKDAKDNKRRPRSLHLHYRGGSDGGGGSGGWGGGGGGEKSRSCGMPRDIERVIEGFVDRWCREGGKEGGEERRDLREEGREEEREEGKIGGREEGVEQAEERREKLGEEGSALQREARGKEEGVRDREGEEDRGLVEGGACEGREGGDVGEGGVTNRGEDEGEGSEGEEGCEGVGRHESRKLRKEEQSEVGTGEEERGTEEGGKREQRDLRRRRLVGRGGRGGRRERGGKGRLGSRSMKVAVEGALMRMLGQRRVRSEHTSVEDADLGENQMRKAKRSEVRSGTEEAEEGAEVGSESVEHGDASERKRRKVGVSGGQESESFSTWRVTDGGGTTGEGGGVSLKRKHVKGERDGSGAREDDLEAERFGRNGAVQGDVDAMREGEVGEERDTGRGDGNGARERKGGTEEREGGEGTVEWHDSAVGEGAVRHCGRDDRRRDDGAVGVGELDEWDGGLKHDDVIQVHGVSRVAATKRLASEIERHKTTDVFSLSEVSWLQDNTPGALRAIKRGRDASLALLRQEFRMPLTGEPGSVQAQEDWGQRLDQALSLLAVLNRRLAVLQTHSATDHSDNLSHGVRVEVQSKFQVMDQIHFGALYHYRVRIRNEGVNEPVQLVSRQWVIKDFDGNIQEVIGPGVIGKQPILDLGSEFEYISYTPLPSKRGTMHGSFLMLACNSNRLFDVQVGPFGLIPPPRPQDALGVVQGQSDPNGESIGRTTKEAAIQQLLAIRERIASGELDFGQVAKTESHCSSARNNGDLGWFSRGQMQRPFEEATFGINVGEMSGIVDTDSGVHIILRTG
ncbi:unnamed protein product [Closterium sp. NIES-53]